MPRIYDPGRVQVDADPFAPLRNDKPLPAPRSGLERVARDTASVGGIVKTAGEIVGSPLWPLAGRAFSAGANEVAEGGRSLLAKLAGDELKAAAPAATAATATDLTGYDAPRAYDPAFALEDAPKQELDWSGTKDQQPGYLPPYMTDFKQTPYGMEPGTGFPEMDLSPPAEGAPRRWESVDALRKSAEQALAAKRGPSWTPEAEWLEQGPIAYMQGLKDQQIAGYTPAGLTEAEAAALSGKPAVAAPAAAGLDVPSMAAPTAAPAQPQTPLTTKTATDEQLARARERLSAIASTGSATARERLAAVDAEIAARKQPVAAPAQPAPVAAPAAVAQTAPVEAGPLSMEQYLAMARNAATPADQAKVIEAANRVDTPIESLYDLWSDKPKARLIEAAKGMFPRGASPEEADAQVALAEQRRAAAEQAKARAAWWQSLSPAEKMKVEAEARRAEAQAGGELADTARKDAAAPGEREKTAAETKNLESQTAARDYLTPIQGAKTISETDRIRAKAAAAKIAATIRASGGGAGVKADPNNLGKANRHRQEVYDSDPDLQTYIRRRADVVGDLNQAETEEAMAKRVGPPQGERPVAPPGARRSDKEVIERAQKAWDEDKKKYDDAQAVISAKRSQALRKALDDHDRAIAERQAALNETVRELTEAAMEQYRAAVGLPPKKPKAKATKPATAPTKPKGVKPPPGAEKPGTEFTGNGKDWKTAADGLAYPVE